MEKEQTTNDKEQKKALEQAYMNLISLNCKTTTPMEADKLIGQFSMNIDALDAIGETPFIKSLLAGNFDLAKYFLGKGANMYAYDTGGRTSMMICAEKGYIEFARILLKNGYDLNKKVPSNNHPVLSLAIWANQLEMTRFLLQNSANPNLEDNMGWTAYDVANFCGCPEILSPTQPK